MSEVKTDKLSPRTSSGTVTLGTSGDTFSIPSGVTLSNSGTATGFGLDGTPNFLASLTGSHTPANNVETTAVYNTVAYDSDSGYDNTTGEYTIPSGKGGKYLFSASWNATTTTTSVTWTGADDYSLTTISVKQIQGNPAMMTNMASDDIVAWTPNLETDFDVARSSWTTRRNASGYIEDVAPNVPRLNY